MENVEVLPGTDNPTDRLVGPARLVIMYGGVPEALSTAIAAAIFYDEPSDPIALQLKEIREQKGIDYILHNICKLEDDKDEVLLHLIREKIEMLKGWGWIE